MKTCLVKKNEPGTLGYNRKGQFIAGGWFATLWIVEADLDFIHKRLGMRNVGTLCPCSWRGADSDPLSVPWSDFRPLDAKWLQQVYDKAQFLAALGPNRNPLLSLPGVSQDTFWPDYMHCKYMGVDQFFLASVLVVMVFMIPIPHCATLTSELHPGFKRQGEMRIKSTPIVKGNH